MKKILLISMLSAMLFSCNKELQVSNDTNPATVSNASARNGIGLGNDIIYIETNDFHTNQNAILAYHHVGNDQLQHFGGPFYTRGSGVGNPQQLLGPLDSDFELRLSSDGQFLLAVNSGSNTIAVFSIRSNGQLDHVPGSPFPSGGQTPCSIDVNGDHVYVVNKSDDPLHTITQAPNYVTFTIDANGALTLVPGGKVETTRGSSPSQVLVSRDHLHVFGDDFLGFTLMPPVGTLRSFNISGNGTLSPLAGTPYFLPGNAAGMNGALGLYTHPAGNILYVGFPALGQVGVYAINNATGALTFQNVTAAGKAACWIRTNKAGSRMYVLNSGDNTVQVYNSTSPAAPVTMQTLLLKKSGPDYIVPGIGTLKTSEPFSFALSTDETKLYIVNQHTNPDFSIGNYNYLHYLNVNANGTLAENSEPIQIPVPNTVRPKGSLVLIRD